MSHQVTVPWFARDAAFAQRILAVAGLKEAGAPKADMDALMAVPLVATRTFDATRTVECPRGHEDEHAIMLPPVNHDGKPAMARRCQFCGSTWLELKP
jgi:hypothetical protein